jgi:hypothetical protein
VSFQADISVPKERGLTVVQSGDAAPTLAESLARACFTAGVYYVQDIGYPYAIVQMYECCDACGGSGKLPKYRGRKRIACAWKPCKACGERGHWTVGEPERVGLP